MRTLWAGFHQRDNLTETLANSRNPFTRSRSWHSPPINELNPLLIQIKEIFIARGTLEPLEWPLCHQAIILP